MLDLWAKPNMKVINAAKADFKDSFVIKAIKEKNAVL